MGSIAMTRMTDGLTKAIAVPLTQVALTHFYPAGSGVDGVVIEGKGKDCAVRIAFSDAEARAFVSRMNAVFARAGRAQREAAGAGSVAAVPPVPTEAPSVA